jgi:hypothetical protein
VCSVGEEQYGLETVMEVEDESWLEQILGQGQELFSGARHTRANRAERRIEVCGFGKLVSCGDSGVRGRRTELDLGRRKSLDDHHAAATFETATKGAGLLGGRCCWFYLRL